GYAESESDLARVALEWMLAEAYANGLKLNKHRTDVVLGRNGQKPPPSGVPQMHNSLTVAWWPAEFVPKKHYDWHTKATNWRMNLFRRRTIPAGSLVHESAFQRGREYQSLLPSDAVRVASLPLP